MLRKMFGSLKSIKGGSKEDLNVARIATQIEQNSKTLNGVFGKGEALDVSRISAKLQHDMSGNFENLVDTLSQFRSK